MTETSRQKLLVVITKSNFGGAQRYVFDLARSLKDTHDVVVACGGNGLLVDKLRDAGIRTVSLSALGRDVSIFKDFYSFVFLVRLLWKERPNVTHFNSSKIGIMGAVASFLAPRTRTVFTAHAWAFNENRGTLSKVAIAALHWLTVALCDRTIAVSQGVKDQISHLPLMDRKIQVVHLGIEPLKPLTRAEARAQLGMQGDSFSIGTIAELHPVKGLEYALTALKTVPFPYSYTIIGAGDLRDSLQKIISETPALAQSVKLTGFVADAWKLLPAFDIFLLPSLSEAFGYVLLEAGYSQIPVVATSVGGIPEVIVDMESGVLIHPKNTKEIASAVTFFEQNKDATTEFGANLKRRVETEFSLKRMIEKTLEIYKG